MMFYRREAVHVSLAHRYHNPAWDLARNRQVYGEDHSVEGVGANMTVWLEVEGELEPKTDLLFHENGLAPSLEHAKKMLDHRCLFEVEPWFQDRVSSAENIALFLRQGLRAKPPPRGRWGKLVLVENQHWLVSIEQNGSHLTHTFLKEGWKMAATVQADVDAESGLLMGRGHFRAAVSACRPPSSPEAFFKDLKSHLPQLIRLTVYPQLPSAESYEFACVAQ